MNELWKVLLSSGRSLEEMEEYRFVFAKTGSPYREVQEESVEISALSQATISVNPYLRLAQIFRPLTEDNEFLQTEEGKLLFHTFTELIFQIDRYAGYDKTAFLKELLWQEIVNGCFGEQETETFLSLSLKQRSRTLENLIALYTMRGDICYFIKEMQDIFPGCVIFRHREIPKQIYVYMGREKSQVPKKQLDFVKKLFLPMDYECSISWEYAYALLDAERMYSSGNRMA